MADIFDLSGKVALIIGGSKGLGKAMARALAERGAGIVISSRHEEELRPALDEILQGTGQKGCFIVAHDDPGVGAADEAAPVLSGKSQGSHGNPHKDRF